jgi:hypothetical protein
MQNELKISYAEFAEILAHSKKRKDKVLTAKAKEYGGDEADRLEDFFSIARVANVPIETVWNVLIAKHFVSIQKMLAGRIENSQAMRDEKFGDFDNYGTLGEAIALLKERMYFRDLNEKVENEYLENLAVANTGWIPISEKLPPTGLEVLLYAPQWVGEYMDKSNGVRIGYLCGNGRFWVSVYFCEKNGYTPRTNEKLPDGSQDYAVENQIPTHWKEILPPENLSKEKKP